VAIAVAAIIAVAGMRRTPAAVDIGGWLQGRLDRAGGVVYLARLPGGRCYQTRGLWVSHSDTTIASNGACLDVVGPGPVRLRSGDGDPIAAAAGLFIGHSAINARPPARITIEGLHIHVASAGVDGIDVYARQVRIRDVLIDGDPFDDVYIGGRTNLIHSSQRVSVAGSTLLDAERNGVSVTAVIDAQIRGNTIGGAGGRLGPYADPGDGIDVEPNSATDPIVALTIADNRIVGNIGQGVALRLRPQGRPCLHAGLIRIVDNLVAGNQPFGGDAQITTNGTQTKLLIAGNRPQTATGGW
jgi:hypothetical protein